MSRLSHVRIHQEGCVNTEFGNHTVSDALVDVNLAESSAPVTPRNVDYAPGRDSDQEEYMVARADLPSPLVAISKGNKAPLGADIMLAKSGGNPDGTMPHAA